MNLIRLIILIVGLIWMLTFSQCSIMQETMRKYRLRLIQDTVQQSIIQRLEENRNRAILLEKQPTYLVIIRGKDTSYLPLLSKQDSIELALRTLSFTWIQTERTKEEKNHQTLFGSTNTVGNTLKIN